MDPLSPWTYARRNTRKILPTVIILTFVVMLVVLMLTTLRGLKESALQYTRQFDHWTMVFPKSGPQLTTASREALRDHPDVERVITARSCYVRMKALIAHVPFRVYGVTRDEMDTLFDRSGTRLVKGRLPQKGRPEVALHENIMKANGWSLESRFGIDEDEDDWMPGRFTVVGILRGPTPIGVASVEYLQGPLYQYAPKLWVRILIVPKPGRMAAMNAFLRGLGDAKVWDKERAVVEVSRSFDRILLILNFISVVLIVVISLVVGLIHNIFFSQRMDEFAMLLAIGYTKRIIFRRVTAETAGIMTVAWAAGVAVGFGLLAVFRAWVLEPRGIPLPLAQVVPVLVSAGLPLVALVFAMWTVAGRLRKLDPVTIIERRG